MTDTVDVEACVNPERLRNLADRILNMPDGRADRDPASLRREAEFVRALASALPGMGKDRGFTQKDVDNLRAMPDGTGYASVDDPEWFESLIARVADRAAQPEETSADAT